MLIIEKKFKRSFPELRLGRVNRFTMFVDKNGELYFHTLIMDIENMAGMDAYHGETRTLRRFGDDYMVNPVIGSTRELLKENIVFHNGHPVLRLADGYRTWTRPGCPSVPVTGIYMRGAGVCLDALPEEDRDDLTDLFQEFKSSPREQMFA